MDNFYGRNNELESMRWLTGKKTASLVVIKGRRRIGKSRLIQHFGKNKNFYRFSGYPPLGQPQLSHNAMNFRVN